MAAGSQAEKKLNNEQKSNRVQYQAQLMLFQFLCDPDRCLGADQ